MPTHPLNPKRISVLSRIAASLALLSTCLYITPVAFSQVASPAQAQAASPPPSPPPPSPPLSTTLAIDRELIARWYLRVDAAWSRSLSTTPPPTAQQIAEANKTFDRASLAFFRLAIPEAIGILRDLEQSLSSKPPIESPLLSLQIEPRIWNSIAGDAPSQTLPSITLTTLQTPTSDATLTGDLTLISYTDSQEVLPTTFSTTTTLTLELKAGTQSTLNLSDYKYFAPFFENRKASKPARIEVTFTPKSGSPVSDWLIIPSDSFPSQRKANQIALDEAKQNISPLTYSLFKSRNNLLTNRPSRNNSSQFLARYETLENELQKELTSIKQGQSPYPLRDRWFASFQSGSASIPLWIQAPHVPATNKQFPAPLLILLHGAGGDESMFFFGYGQGIYPKLGVEAGMVVVAPNTTQMLTLPNAFDDLLKMLEELYSIDRSRIYLVGHSMGAAAASTLAQRHSDTIAALACLAGGQINPQKPTPPALFIAGSLDPIIPINRIRQGLAKAFDAGLPITLIEKPDHGHTLIVSDHAREVIEFLKNHQRQP